MGPLVTFLPARRLLSKRIMSPDLRANITMERIEEALREVAILFVALAPLWP